jgi:mRNA-degrading endonuclease RelE of RelBE toxin-antitoxin system
MKHYFKGARKLRVGKYRIIFEINNENNSRYLRNHA